MFAVGLGWIFASLHVYLRDTAQVLSVIFTFWFWMTPIFIGENDFPPPVRFVISGSRWLRVRAIGNYSCRIVSNIMILPSSLFSPASPCRWRLFSIFMTRLCRRLWLAHNGTGGAGSRHRAN